MTNADYVEVLAHFALADPDKKMEKEIAYKEQLADILRERAERAR